MTEIERIHDEVFECLWGKYFEEKKKGNNFFFTTRRRFLSGRERFWFLGTNDYLAVSFWTGSDYMNKTSKIYFEIRPDGMINLYIVGKSDEEKRPLLEALALSIFDMHSLGNGIWRKTYTIQHGGQYIEFLMDFLNTDKALIDQYLLDHLDEFNSSSFLSKSKIDGPNDSGPLSDDDTLNEPFIRQLSRQEFYKMIAGILYKKFSTEDVFFNEHLYLSSGRHFTLKSLYVRDFKGIDKIDLRNIPVDAKWIVLTGENGYGKTSVLQSIAIGLYGNNDGSYKLLPDESFVMVEGKCLNLNFFNSSFGYEVYREYFTVFEGHFAVYGATRLNTAGEFSTTTYNLFYPNGSLVNIENELKEAHAYQPAKFELLKYAFCRLIPDLKDIRIDASGGKPIVKYLEQDKEGNSYNEVAFEHLAAGFRNIIAVVGDIITRLSPKGELVSLVSFSYMRGIVIIDEIELHLHPRYQKDLPQALTELFPNIQFIVSTHSPIPLLGMPKETVLLNVKRNKEDGVTVERIEIDNIETLNPNIILTSPIFGFSGIFSNALTDMSKLKTEDTWQDAKKDEKLDKDLLSLYRARTGLEQIRKPGKRDYLAGGEEMYKLSE